MIIFLFPLVVVFLWANRLWHFPYPSYFVGVMGYLGSSTYYAQVIEIFLFVLVFISWPFPLIYLDWQFVLVLVSPAFISTLISVIIVSPVIVLVSPLVIIIILSIFSPIIKSAASIFRLIPIPVVVLAIAVSFPAVPSSVVGISIP